MYTCPDRRNDDQSAPLPFRKMGVRSARPTPEDEPLLQSFKHSENKVVFLAEHGYVLAGGTLCFLMGIMVSLVIVWIIILICNRQISLERISSQAKVAALYGEFSLRSHAVKKPYVDLTKILNCSTHVLIAPANYRMADLQTALALAYEAGMQFVQGAVNKAAYNSLFPSIFAAAIIMLLIEIICIVIFLAYKNNWHGFRDTANNSSGTKYSFLIQGPKVLHHGVFEVTNSLSQAGLQVKALLNRASQSFCPQQDDHTHCPPVTTEMTITVQPQPGQLPCVPEMNEDDETLLGRDDGRPRYHPTTREPYCSENECWRTAATETTPTVEDLQSGSVGLQTLREHLQKCRLLVPDFPDLDTANGSLQAERDSVAVNQESVSEERISMMARPSPAETLRLAGKLPKEQSEQFRESAECRRLPTTSPSLQYHSSRNYNSSDPASFSEHHSEPKRSSERPQQSRVVSTSSQKFPGESGQFEKVSVAPHNQSRNLSSVPEEYRQSSFHDRESGNVYSDSQRHSERHRQSDEKSSAEHSRQSGVKTRSSSQRDAEEQRGSSRQLSTSDGRRSDNSRHTGAMSSVPFNQFHKGSSSDQPQFDARRDTGRESSGHQRASNEHSLTTERNSDLNRPSNYISAVQHTQPRNNSSTDQRRSGEQYSPESGGVLPVRQSQKLPSEPSGGKTSGEGPKQSWNSAMPSRNSERDNYRSSNEQKSGNVSGETAKQSGQYTLEQRAERFLPNRQSDGRHQTVGSLPQDSHRQSTMASTERLSQPMKPSIRNLEERSVVRDRRPPSTGVTFEENRAGQIVPPAIGSTGSHDESPVHTPRVASPIWADPDFAPVINADHQESEPDASANSERLAELIDKENFEDDRT